MKEPVKEQSAPKESVLDKVSSAPIPDPATQVLVAGEPALTQGMVSNFSRFMEWLLDAPLTNAQKQELQEAIVVMWKRRNEAEISGVLELLKLRDQISQLSDDQRDLLRAQAQPAILAKWRAQPNDSASRWSLAVYDAAHKPIAAGNPPLTRQVTDAYAEVLGFMVTQVSGKSFDVDEKFKNEWARQLATNYKKLSTAQQSQLAQLPLYWAAIRMAWPQLGEAERNQLREQWRVALQSIVPRSQEQIAGDEAAARLQVLITKRQTTPLSPDEMKTAANYMETIAIALRQQGGAQNQAAAVQWIDLAKRYRMEAQPRPTSEPVKTVSSDAAYAKAMAQLQSSHNAYTFMSNMSMMSHAASINAINIMGGSPYRYQLHY